MAYSKRGSRVRTVWDSGKSLCITIPRNNEQGIKANDKVEVSKILEEDEE